MKNKEQLLMDIEKLPKFVKRDIYIKAEEFKINAETGIADAIVESQDAYIQEKRLLAITEEYKSPIITTVSKNYIVVQFKEVFEPIINYFEGVNGDLRYYWGSSVLKLFPDGDSFKTEDGKRIGLIVSNSVNKMLAIQLNFSVLLNGYYVVLPKLSGFRHLHLGKVREAVKDYETFIVEIKKVWNTIIEKFSRNLTANDVENVLGKVKLGKKYNKQLRKTYEVVEGANLKLWDLFIDIVHLVSDRNYKREENKVKKLKLVSEVVYTYAFMEQL